MPRCEPDTGNYILNRLLTETAADASTASMQDRANGSATAYAYDSLKRLTSTTTTKFPTVTNASFESMAIPNWTGTAQIWSNAEHGLYSVQLGQIQQNVNCNSPCASTTYTVSGYMLGSSSSSALQVTVVGNTSAGAYQYAPAGQIFYASASTWAPFSYGFTTPSNLTGGLFVTLTSVITGPIYLDNITVGSDPKSSSISAFRIASSIHGSCYPSGETEKIPKMLATSWSENPVSGPERQDRDQDAAIYGGFGGSFERTGPQGTWVSETAWIYSGGGPSDNGIALPAWQIGVANAANGGSTTLRNVPDVAMEGNTDNFACGNGKCYGGDGWRCR